MPGHEVTIQFCPTANPEWDDTYVAICSCRRWRSKHYTDKRDAENLGAAHAYNGDQQNRAAASFDHGRPTLASQAKWYRKMADDPATTPKEREQWIILAEEAEKRAAPPDSSEQIALF